MNVTLYFAIAVNIVHIILYVWVATWIHNVSNDPKCTCARNWRKHYIIIFPIISFVIQMFTLSGVFTGTYKHMLTILYLPVFVGWVLFIVFSIQYLNGLKKGGCDCATKNKSGDNALIAYMSIKIAIFVIAIIAVIILISSSTMTMIKSKAT